MNETSSVEFVAATMNRKKILQASRLEAAFKVFDKNGDGQLNLDEIKAIFSDDLDIPDDEWKRLIQEVDRDKNGEVSSRLV